MKRFVFAILVVGCTDPHETERKRECPDLKTWSDCERRIESRKETAAAAAASVAKAQLFREKTETVQAQVDAVWSEYDRSPTKTKASLAAALEASLGKIRTASGVDFVVLANGTRAQSRLRMAPLIRPETKAVGDGYVTLVPHPQNAVCALWASMWLKESETAVALGSVGFTLIKCGEREWNVPAPAPVARTGPGGATKECSECDQKRVGCLLAVQRGELPQGSEQFENPAEASKQGCVLDYMACRSEHGCPR